MPDKEPAPWYADLRVVISLADVIGLTISDAITQACRGDKLIEWMTYKSKSKMEELVRGFCNREIKYMLCTSDGTLARKTPNETGMDVAPHSVVHLVCPTFAEACEHTKEFLMMFTHASPEGPHHHKSDDQEWEDVFGALMTVAHTMKGR